MNSKHAMQEQGKTNPCQTPRGILYPLLPPQISFWGTCVWSLENLGYVTTSQAL